MVILDEVHHCGDSENKAWGPSVIGAFEHCEQILSLSGTPFRTDNNPIPFAKYVTKESSDRNFMVVDFDYGYGSALRDGGIVRDIIFPIYNSKVGWRTLNYGDQFYELSKVIKDKRSRALNIALSPTSDYVRGVLEEATIKLDTIRARGNHKDAGGLVIARDIADAKKIAKLLTDICEEPVAIVHSGDKDASSKIDSFRYSNKKWIVSVKMISEGVDIPRLRVGVYLSNIKTEVFFRQAIGRIIRWMDGVKMQTAFFFFPMMEPFITYMKDMAELVYDQYKHTEPKSQPGTGQGRHTQPELYTPIEGEITDMSEVRGTVQYSSDLMDAGVQAFQDRYPAIVDYIEILGRSTLTQIALDAGYTSEEIEFEVNVRDQGHKHHRSKHEIMADDRKRANKAVIALAFRMLDLGHFDNKDEAMKAMNDEYAQQNGYVSGASNHQYFLDKEAWALDRLRKLS
jgi:superfamily II DNA or RNA helicase